MNNIVLGQIWPSKNRNKSKMAFSCDLPKKVRQQCGITVHTWRDFIGKNAITQAACHHMRLYLYQQMRLWQEHKDMFTGDLEIQSMRTETWFFWRTTWLKINMCSLSKKHTSVCVLLLLLSSSLIPLDFQNIVICCWKMSRTAKIVSIEPPDPISDPRVEEILMDRAVQLIQ